MSDFSFTVQPNVKVAGRTFTEPGGAMLFELIVDSDLTAADSCTLTLLDPWQDALEGVEFGARVEVKAPSVNNDKVIDLFVGEVYALEFEADERGTFARILAFDQSYRLKQHRVTAVYTSMTDSDIAKKIAGDAGLKPGKIDSSSAVHEHVAQLNETHWDFLRSRAARNDFEVYVEDGKLNFARPEAATRAPEPGGHDSRDPLQLTSGKNLMHLRTRMSGAQQVGNIEVRGWDPTTKKQVMAKAKADTRAFDLKKSTSDLARKVGTDRRVSVQPSFNKQTHCEELAKALAERASSSFAYAEGVAFGDPRMKAGVPVAIGETGPFDGKYTLTRARHVFRSGDYSTRFTVSGRHDRSHYGLSAAPETDKTWPGAYPAVVTNLKDPDNAARVKVHYPWLDDEFESDWARVCQLGAGQKETGILWFPEVDDEVLVMFIGGDPKHPVVLGGLYNGKDKVPFAEHLDKDKGTVEVRGMKSRIGHQISMVDKKGEERVEIISSDEKLSIVIDQKKGSIEITSDGDVNVTAAKNASVKAKGDAVIEAGGNLNLKAGSNCEIEAGAKLLLKGQLVEVKGQPIKLN